jgi:Fe-S-cluster containining protein
VSAELGRAWLAAAADEKIAAELEAVYAYIAAAVESRGPACWASGRCCNFERAGHRLYVTGLEAAYTARRAGRGVSAAEIEAARAAGGCPFQEGNLCGVHAARPLGCRVYFCDRSAEEWQRELTERALAMVRGIHDRHGIEYRYAEWRGLLEVIAAAKAAGG